MCSDGCVVFQGIKNSSGVALRAGLLRAPLSLDPGTPGLLRTLHIPNAVRNVGMLQFKQPPSCWRTVISPLSPDTFLCLFLRNVAFSECSSLECSFFRRTTGLQPGRSIDHWVSSWAVTLQPETGGVHWFSFVVFEG